MSEYIKAMPGKVVLEDLWRDVSPERKTASGLYMPLDAENDSVARVHSVGPGVHPDIVPGLDVFFAIDSQRCESFQSEDGRWWVCIPQDDVIGVVENYVPGIFD